MNNTNYLISIDNLGYASYLLEQEFNPDHLVGQGPFVGAFSTSNSADISPNILGPRCYVRKISIYFPNIFNLPFSIEKWRRMRHSEQSMPK